MQRGSGILAESALIKHFLPANFDNDLALAQKLQTVPEDALPLEVFWKRTRVVNQDLINFKIESGTERR